MCDRNNDLAGMQWLMWLTDVGVASHSSFYLVPKGWAAIQQNLSQASEGAEVRQWQQHQHQ